MAPPCVFVRMCFKWWASESCFSCWIRRQAAFWDASVSSPDLFVTLSQRNSWWRQGLGLEVPILGIGVKEACSGLSKGDAKGAGNATLLSLLLHQRGADPFALPYFYHLLPNPTSTSRQIHLGRKIDRAHRKFPAFLRKSHSLCLYSIQAFQSPPLRVGEVAIPSHIKLVEFWKDLMAIQVCL